MVITLTDVAVDGLVKLSIGSVLTVLNLKENTHTMQEITLVEITQVHSKLVLLTKLVKMNNNLKLPLNKNQFQFVLMHQTGVNMVVVSSITVVLESIMPSYLLDIPTDNSGILKTHGVHGEKLVTSD